MRVWLALANAPRRVAIAMVRIYQLAISPWLGPSCRFSPTCSSYACECLRDHGVVRGGWFATRRIARCGPWHPGGFDPVPPRLEPMLSAPEEQPL